MAYILGRPLEARGVGRHTHLGATLLRYPEMMMGDSVNMSK